MGRTSGRARRRVRTFPPVPDAAPPVAVPLAAAGSAPDAPTRAPAPPALADWRTLVEQPVLACSASTNPCAVIVLTAAQLRPQSYNPFSGVREQAEEHSAQTGVPADFDGRSGKLAVTEDQ